MPSPLNVLIVEDVESDAALILRELEKADYLVSAKRVESAPELEAALSAGQGWDIVISDYKLPQFDAPGALALLQKSGLDIPFIAVSGTIGEVTAAALMKAGAHDYLMKGNLVRLVPVVRRELAEARRRAEYRQSDQRLRESEARYRTMFENSPISLWEEDFSQAKLYIDGLRAGGVTDFRAYFDAHPAEVKTCARLVEVLDVNQASLAFQRVGSKAELITSLDKLIPDEAVQEFLPELLMIADGFYHFEYEGINEYGRDFSVHWQAVSGHEQDLGRVIVSIQDISQRKQAERQLRQAEMRLRSLVEKMPAIVYTEKADEPGRIVYISPQIEQLTGYAPALWMGTLGFWKLIIHPDDFEMVNAAELRSEQTGEAFKVDCRILTRTGAVVWMRDEAVLIHDEDGQPLFWQGVKYDINDEKRSESELKESQGRLAQLMSNLPGMAVRSKLDPDWEMEFASEGCLALTGFTADELTADQGRGYGSRIHPEDRELVRAAIREAAREKGQFQVRYRILAANGQEKWVWEKGQVIEAAQPGPLCMEAFVIDITESKQAEAAIQRHLSELEVLYQNSLDINRLLDPRQIANKVVEILRDKMNWHHIAIRLYNEQTGEVELLALNQPGPGLHAEQEVIISQSITKSMSGLSGWVYQHGESVLCPRVSEDSRYVQTHPDIRSGLYVPLKAGERTIGSISVESQAENAFNEQDERFLMILSNQATISIENAQLFLMARVELAARKQVEAELLQAQSRLELRVAERTAELKNANFQLEKAARLKDEFLSSMSHELRTPLTGILGLSEVLQLQTYGPLSDKQMTAMNHIASSGRHLLEMINDILDFSRIEARQLILRLAACQVTQVCQSGLRAISDQAQKKNITTKFAIDRPGLVIQADPGRLKQMLTNLLSNAIKFTPAGGSIGIEVTSSQVEQVTRITVWDTGIGIRSEDRPRLFQTFVQLDASLARQYNGTGLGLVLVKRLAELHGGSVSVESSFGVGSRFTISLPWEAGDDVAK
ncbi:MAG: PAS domain-containing protein [Chloroflexi bacterium]|nr:PAS domain-containing protein [Chloroflexota bacterium]